MYPFNKLPGHAQIKAYLAQLLSAPPSTLLFQGPRGVGKTSFAQAFAQALLSDTHSKKLELNCHPDLRELYPEGKACMHPMQAIRSLIHEVHIPPFEAKRKIFLIHEADRMLPSSSNALLKTLEEPPSYVHFILVTSQSESILPTILSRCLQIEFFLLSQDDIALYLQETLGKSRDEAYQISWLAQGSFTKAKNLAIGKDNSFLNIITKMGTAALHRCYDSLFYHLKEIEALIEGNQSSMTEAILTAIYCWYRDLHLLKMKGDRSLLFFRGYEEMLEKNIEVPLPELSEIQKRMNRVQEALSCHISLRHCLIHLMI